MIKSGASMAPSFSRGSWRMVMTLGALLGSGEGGDGDEVGEERASISWEGEKVSMTLKPTPRQSWSPETTQTPPSNQVLISSSFFKQQQINTFFSWLGIHNQKESKPSIIVLSALPLKKLYSTFFSQHKANEDSSIRERTGSLRGCWR